MCASANEAEKRKALGRPSIDPKMAAKKTKKSAEAEPKSSRQGQPSIVFPAGMTGLKPKVPSAASEQKKTRQAEAEARRRKHQDSSKAAPSTKKLKTKASKSSRKERATAQVPLDVKPISVAPPDNRERCRVIHEPTSTEAPESEEIPSVDPNTAEDIGREDNVNYDEVLP